MPEAFYQASRDYLTPPVETRAVETERSKFEDWQDQTAEHLECEALMDADEIHEANLRFLGVAA